MMPGFDMSGSQCITKRYFKSASRGNGSAEESPVGGESLLNVNKAAGQGEMERKIKKCVHS